MTQEWEGPLALDEHLKKEIEQIQMQLDKIRASHIEQSKKTHLYCGRILLYPSEAQTIHYIAETSTTNITDISQSFGLTRGAVSKMTVKLEKLGLIKRYKYLYNQKEVYLHLTDLGVQVYEEYRTIRQQREVWLQRFFADASHGAKETVACFLESYYAANKG